MPVWVSPPPKTPVAAPSPTGGRTAAGEEQSCVSTAPMAVVKSQGRPCRPGCAHPPPEPWTPRDVPVHKHVSLQYNQRLRLRKVAAARLVFGGLAGDPQGSLPTQAHPAPVAISCPSLI